MNEEMKQKLEKYMKENGYYDTAAIRRDEAMKAGKIDSFESQSPIGKAVDGYYEAIKPAKAGVTTDYDLQEKLGADYLASLDPEMRERVIKELAYSKDETYAQLLRDRQQLQEDFNQRDLAWEMAQAAEPRLAAFRTFDAFYDDAVAGFKTAGLNNSEAMAMADKYTALYSKFMSAQAKAYLTGSEEHFALLKLLDRWGYNVPADLRAYAR